MDEILPLPTICVDLDSLYDGSYDRSSIANNGATSKVGEELSLVVRLDKEICPVLSGDSSPGTLPRPLDLQQVDFLGSVDVVKKLFSMPYTDQRPLFTLHRMGNTLLLDNVTCHDTNPYDINFFAESKSHKDQGNSSNERSIPPASASTAEKKQSLQYADSSFNSLDHLIASANVESLLGKVTPLYLPAPLKLQSKQQLGLLTNEETHEVHALDSSRQELQIDAMPCDGEKSCPPLSVEETITSERLGISPRNCTFIGEKLKATQESTKEDSTHPYLKIPGFEEYRREVSIASGSPFLPPPNYFMPSVPPPARQVLSWNLHEMRLALSSDLTIYRTDQHPAFTVKSLDTTKEFELSTCLDFYLDNVMANVPEFALALHTKGFIRGIKLLRTSDIPFLNPSELSDSPKRYTDGYDSRNISFKERGDICSPHNPSPDLPVAKGSASITVPTIRGSEDSSTQGLSDHCSSGSNGIGLSAGVRLQKKEEQQPMFDPKVIDMDASAIMRFLQANCRREDGTYILRQSAHGDALHLYDLGLASSSKQKHFKWMLAMISYRFAIRLGHHIKIATPRCRTQIRQRQMHLFASCYQLLREIKEMGGEDHGSIRAAVLEQMADAHLSRVDDFSSQVPIEKDSSNQANSLKGERKEGTERERVQADDEEDFDQHEELQEAVQLLSRAVECLGALINKEIASAADKMSSRDEAESQAGQHTVDPLGASSKIIFDQEEVAEGNDVSNGDDEGISGRGGIVETLAVQLAGVLHKLVQASLVMVMNCIRTAKIAECLDCLSRLVAPCDLWSQLRLTILSTMLHENERKMEEDRRNCEGLWGADMTIVQSLPILWDLTGETCREIAKQTAGISLEDTDIKQQLETLVLSWGRLSQSVLRTGAGPLRSSIDLPSSPPASAIGRPSAPCDSQVAGASGLEGIAAVSISSKRAKARAKAKGRAKENVQSHAQIVKNFRETLASTVSSRNWQMLASSLPSILESTNISNCQKSENDGANSSDRLDPVRALYNIHSIVAPLVLHDLKHLDCLSQLTCVLKENTDQTDSVLPSAVPIAFTASVVNAVGIDKGCQNELQVNLLMTYCFLSAALLHHLKAIGGIKHHTEESRNTDNSDLKKSSAMKSKTQRSQRAGGAVGPIGLKVSDANVRLCLRRLGDSCNGISQRLVAYSAAALCDNNEGDALKNFISATNSSNATTISSPSIRGECDALSYQLFSASLVVFESVGDISNAAMVRCNLSSLLRSRATWEMAQNKSCKAGKESFQICYDRSLKHLMEALKHCDQAILSFDGSNSYSGDKRKISIPKGNIRDNVALETAQTCLNIGVLKKSEIFRSHVYGAADKDKELQALLFAEKEDAVVGALESALELFYESRNDRQAAAVHYQLGSFYSSYWPLYPSRSDGLLEKALLHYREAHSYYSKYDVGPTLLLILIDMCDLYLSAYSATEPFLKSVKPIGDPDEITDSTVLPSPTSLGLQRRSTVEESAADGLKDKERAHGSNDDGSGPSVCPESWSQSELVVALLGGALQSLLESRFAFTPAVAERSRYRSQILSLAGDVAKRLSGVLIKVLRAHSKGLLPSPDNLGSDKISASAFLSEVESKSVKELRLITPAPPPAFTSDDFNDAMAASVCTTDPNNMVIEARMICTELLRWSAVTVAPSPTSEIENKSTTLGGNGNVISSTPSYSLSGSEGTLSVHRLYELINMVNQNAWLRRCATSSK